jgi:hypothetical protein
MFGLLFVCLDFVTGIRIGFMGYANEIRCDGLDVIISIVPNACTDIVSLTLGPSHPFGSYEWGKKGPVIVLMDRSAGIREYPEQVAPLTANLRILFALGPEVPVDEEAGWQMDAVITQPGIYDTNTMRIQRSLYMSLGSCPQAQVVLPDVPVLSADIMRTPEHCIVSIDGRVAHFDAQIQWLQATLAEDPCRESSFVIFSLSFGDLLDSEVKDFLRSHTLIDVIASPTVLTFDESTLSVDIQRDGSIEFKPDGTLVHRAGCLKTSDPIITGVSKRDDRVTRYPPSAVFADTPMGNVVFAVIVSILSGLSLNIAFRRSLMKRMYDPLGLA